MTAAPPAATPRLPAGIWVLGFVSLLMDISSEMIHALLPLFMVGTLGMGVALGAVLGGWVIDAYGAQAGFAVSLGAGTGVLLFAVLGYRLLHNSTLPRTASLAG